MKKKIVILIVKIGLIIVALCILLSDVDYEQLKNTLCRVELKYLLIVIILVALEFVIRSIKWKSILKEISFIDGIKGILVSHALSYTIGGQLVGDGGRAVITTVTGVSKMRIVASVVVDKVLGLMGVFFIGLMGGLFAHRSLSRYVLILLFLVSLVGMIIVSVVMNPFLLTRVRLYVEKWVPRNNLVVMCKNRIIRFINSFSNYSNDSTAIRKNILLSILTQVCSVSISYVLLLGLDSVVSFAYLCTTSEITSLAGLIPISAFGVGVTQFTEVGMLEVYGINREVIYIQVLLKYSIMVFYAILGWLFVLLPQGKRKSDI